MKCNTFVLKCFIQFTSPIWMALRKKGELFIFASEREGCPKGGGGGGAFLQKKVGTMRCRKLWGGQWHASISLSLILMLSHFSSVLHFIQKSVIWFPLQIDWWLVSICNATLGLNGLTSLQISMIVFSKLFHFWINGCQKIQCSFNKCIADSPVTAFPDLTFFQGYYTQSSR